MCLQLDSQKLKRIMKRNMGLNHKMRLKSMQKISGLEKAKFTVNENSLHIIMSHSQSPCNKLPIDSDNTSSLISSAKSDNVLKVRKFISSIMKVSSRTNKLRLNEFCCNI